MLPGSSKDIGGADVDEVLLEEVLIPKLERNEIGSLNRSLLRKEVRALKEAYCSGRPLWSLVGGVVLTNDEIQSVIDRVYIGPALDQIGAYIEDVRKKTGRGVPPILLIGGSCRLKGLEAGIRSALRAEVLSWDEREFAPVLGAALPDRGAAEDYVDQGANHLRETAYEDAVSAFEEALKQDPKNPEIHIGLSHAYLELGDLAAAESSAREGLKLNPNSMVAEEQLNKVEKAYFGEADKLLKAGKYSEAVKAFEEGQRADPKNPEIHTSVCLVALCRVGSI